MTYRKGKNSMYFSKFMWHMDIAVGQILYTSMYGLKEMGLVKDVSLHWKMLSSTTCSSCVLITTRWAPMLEQFFRLGCPGHGVSRKEVAAGLKWTQFSGQQFLTEPERREVSESPHEPSKIIETFLWADKFFTLSQKPWNPCSCSTSYHPRLLGNFSENKHKQQCSCL